MNSNEPPVDQKSEGEIFVQHNVKCVAGEKSASEVELEDDTDEEEEEPRLKYERITTQLGSIYRNGDATSAFLVAGDKMFIGTHDGNVHILLLPSYELLRVYHAHSATISSISISPFAPPSPNTVTEGISRFSSQIPKRSVPTFSDDLNASPKKNRTISVLPNIPSNAIYIATSSIDGNVCVQSLIDVKDVQLRSFGRPVQAVSLSPEYKTDKTYISGGSSGNLVLTVGGKAGTTSTSNTVGTAAIASGWLGAIGLSGNTGKDTILHSGEGIISTIKWSLSGKYVVWINEHGVKIMRSNLHLDSVDSEFAWKRIGHIDRPDDNNSEEMASVWKARVEWINLDTLCANEEDNIGETKISSPSGTTKTKSQKSQRDTNLEKLLVGWGGTIWILNIHPEGPLTDVRSDARSRSICRPEITKILNLECIVSGLSMFSPNLLIVLAYIYPDEDKNSTDKNYRGQITENSSDPLTNIRQSGARRRIKALSPELCLIDINSSEEIDSDTLTISRYEKLSASDYHLGILPAVNSPQVSTSSRGTLETLSGVGSGMWNATLNATSLLNSSASIRSIESKGSVSTKQSATFGPLRIPNVTQSNSAKQGIKIFIHSPYDCILATKRDQYDHLSWLLEHERYKDAWELIDKNPEVVSSLTEKNVEVGIPASEQRKVENDDFYDNASVFDFPGKDMNTFIEQEKYRIGEIWIQKLIEKNNWAAAGEACSKVLKFASQWESLIYDFMSAGKFDEITDFIPTERLRPPINPEIYEGILGHYIAQNRPKAKSLLQNWSTDLFNIKKITNLLENQLKYRDVRDNSIEDGEVGRDWRIVMESLGKLYIADGHPRDSLKCYIMLQDAETAMSLIREHHLIDVLSEDIPGVILLRVSKQQIDTASIDELKKATSEPISLLVNEAHSGLISPLTVVQQLQKKEMTLYLFFYISALWRGDGIEEHQGETREKLIQDSKALLDQFSDLVVHLFAIYDRELLMEFLKSSVSYTFEIATKECEERDYIPELVYLYSKTGQTKRALYLIIDRLADVSQAISFAKEQNDSDLWEDLLNYSMEKPSFIRGLLEEVGTAINPITLIRRIPEGLEIEGLREGLKRIIKEHEIQDSIGHGVAKVLRSEVALAQNILRSGQQRGVKFDIVHKSIDQTDVKIFDSSFHKDSITSPVRGNSFKTNTKPVISEPGHCEGCHEPFTDDESEILVGFACGHIWHVSHLINLQNHDQAFKPIQIELYQNGDWDAAHNVGTKVTHARLLRDDLRKGCPICNKEGRLT
ncbi:hypothetical protein Golomagni_00219 [Golovinomyces magnicellulatus]|nr:hypothetical protein Golomagni_00219 [Golovinomyces magnicellulatus]